MTSISLKNDYRKKIAVNPTTTISDKIVINENLVGEDKIPKKGAYIYTRVSLIIDKAKQLTGESISLDHQDKQIVEYCEKNNLVIIEKFSDPNIGGASIEKRPGLMAMLSKLKRGIVIVCASVSRLSRNTEDLLCINRTIQERGAELILLDMPISPSSPQGEMLLALLGSVVTLERKQNNLKISQCMSNAAKEGKLITCPKFGYSVENKLYVENPEEQKIIAYIKALLDYDPTMTAGPITRELKDKGFVSKKGKPVHITTVQSIMEELKNPTMPQKIEKQIKELEGKYKK